VSASGRPAIYEDAAARIGRDMYGLDAQRLEREAWSIRAGADPHRRHAPEGGLHRLQPGGGFPWRAVRRGCQAERKKLCDWVYCEIKRKLYLSSPGC
jgi:hypothetical protein